MSTDNSTVAALGSSILLMAIGGWLLFMAGAGIVFRSEVAARFSTQGDVVTTIAAVVAVVGLAALFWAYRIGATATRRRSTPRQGQR